MNILEENETAVLFHADAINRDLIEYVFIFFPPWVKSEMMVKEGIAFETTAPTLEICRARRDNWIQSLKDAHDASIVVKGERKQ
jgi:hypothetical protein